MFGKKHSDESRAKMSSSKAREKKNPMFRRTEDKNPMFGQQHSEKARAKMSSSKGTAVSVLDLQTNEIIIYPSGNQAAKAIPCSTTTFRNYLKSGKTLRERYILK